MNKKRVGMYFSFYLIMALFIALNLSVVSAETIPEAIKEFGDGVWEVLETPVNFILGTSSVGSGSVMFFPKLLFLILVFTIVWVVLEQIDFFNDNSWVMFIISGVVSIISVRYILEFELIRAMILPYTALGVFFVCFLPFIVVFYFIEKIIPTRTMRKIGWIFTAVIFTGLWFVNLDKMGSIAYIYLWTAVACIVFLFLDKTIQRFFQKARMENIKEYHKSKEITDLIDEKMKLDEKVKNAGANPNTAPYKNLYNALKKRAKRLGVEKELFD